MDWRHLPGPRRNMTTVHWREPVQSHGARIAVYSCYFGRHEPFHPDALGPEGEWDRIVFTDHPDLVVAGAQVVQVVDPSIAAAGLSRLPKIRPHLFLAGYDWLIYVDNRARLRCDPAGLIGRIEAEYPQGAPAGRYLFRHGERDCAYRETRVCRRMGSITKAQAHGIKRQFQAAGFPENQGLFVNTCMIQKTGSTSTDQANDLWFSLFMTMAPRDQITLPFVLWQLGTAFEVLPMTRSDVVDWPVFGFRDRRRFRLGLPPVPKAVAEQVDETDETSA